MHHARQAGLPPWVSRRLITVADYHKMAEVGILSPEDRVELIEGEIIEMAPPGSEHAGRVNSLARLLMMAVGSRAVVTVQSPVRLSDILEPRPDFAVLRPRDDFYAAGHPGAADVLLLIEVSSSSLTYDRSVKGSLYARHGGPEFWIVDVRQRLVTVHREPREDGYGVVSQAGLGDTLTIASLPGIALPAADIFPG